MLVVTFFLLSDAHDVSRHARPSAARVCRAMLVTAEEAAAARVANDGAGLMPKAKMSRPPPTIWRGECVWHA